MNPLIVFPYARFTIAVSVAPEYLCQRLDAAQTLEARRQAHEQNSFVRAFRDLFLPDPDYDWETHGSQFVGRPHGPQGRAVPVIAKG